jgi:hypothetical protein
MRITPILLVAAVAGCSDDSVTPSVTITNATPETLLPDDDLLDDLTITVRYDDGDGDLGGGIAEIHDCRADGLVTELPIPQIAPSPGDHITGTLDLHVNDVGAVSSAALPEVCEELGVAELGANEAVFCVILVDAAGNRGAGDCTVPILIE